MRKYFPARTLLEPSVSAPASFPAAPADHLNTHFVSHDASNGSLSPPTGPEFDTNFSPSMAIIMVVLLTSFFFMGFFSVYLKRCTSDRESSNNNAVVARQRETTPEQGLDPAAVESLPMVIYSAVKKTREGKAITECSVCLTEFEDNEPLRLLPKCKHCFHPECIDMWLSSHSTCPLCRRSLLLESLGSLRWGWGSLRGSRRLRNEDTHGGEPMNVATEGGGIGGIDQAGNLSQPREGVSSVQSWRRGPDLKDREPFRPHDSSIVSLRPSASLSSPCKEGTTFRSELRRSHSTGHSRVKRALTRASLVLPGSSSIDHPNEGQPLSSCLPLGASTSPELHRSRSQAMLSNDDMQVEESAVLAGIHESSSSRRWTRSFSFKRAFSLRRSSQEAVTSSSMGELTSSSGAHRTFERLGV